MLNCLQRAERVNSANKLNMPVIPTTHFQKAHQESSNMAIIYVLITQPLVLIVDHK